MKSIKRFSRKWIGKTEYYNVYAYRDINKNIMYQAQYIRVRKVSKYFDDIKEAAKWVDMRLIEDNKEPRNILKKVKK